MYCENNENKDIQESINSTNPLIRMFAVLDRRIGKRTLAKISDTINEQPEWLRQFYNLRFEADKITLK